MLDGLEAQEILFSELEFSRRMDAEYYQKIYLEYEEKVLSNKNDKLENLANFLIGPFGSAYDTNNYTDIPEYRYVRGQDVKPFILKDTDPRYATKEDFDRLKKYALKPRDILVSVVGTLGNACIVKEKDVPAIFSCKSTVIRTKDINPYYLIAYLNSKYGRSLLLRKERGAIQKGLNLDDLKLLDIPLFSDRLDMRIESLLLSMESCIEQAKSLYEQAEKILEKELKFDSYIEPHEKYTSKTLSEVFGKSGRLDAEYYQKKYEDIEQLIYSYKGGYDTVGKICSIKDNNFIPKDNEVYSYIELSNVGMCGEIAGVEEQLGSELPTRARRIVNTNDVIVSSIEGSIEKCALITEENNNYICSNGFYVLSSDTINAETLLVLFKSQFIKQLLKKGCSGTILCGIGKEELKNIPIPIISDDIQNDIRQLIVESYKKRSEINTLISMAIKIIEDAIGIGEDKALNNNNLI
ncbi:MAG: restriction endonuclease subunit S [Lachnospiraceae bacterium]|nr:restriction endonuclease subunit S [Lachnospiraceae bacterium]